MQYSAPCTTFLLSLQSEETSMRRSKMVRPEGLEPPTPRSVVYP